jgi:hypothetical protein
MKRREPSSLSGMRCGITIRATTQTSNPDKYQTDIRDAARKAREIKQYLEDVGLLERSYKEKLERELNRIFPNAQSKEIVEHNGKKIGAGIGRLKKADPGKQ